MRELKFRVWDKHDQRMKQAEMEWFDDMFAFRFYHRGFEEEDNSDVVIMQFTGLKDKNGKEIYEGDILEGWMNTLTESFPFKFDVRYSDVWGSFGVTDEGTWYGFDDMNHDFKVIGNIYENPPKKNS